MVWNQVVDRTRTTQINLGRGSPIMWTNSGHEHLSKFRTRQEPKKIEISDRYGPCPNKIWAPFGTCGPWTPGVWMDSNISQNGNISVIFAFRAAKNSYDLKIWKIWIFSGFFGFLKFTSKTTLIGHVMSIGGLWEVNVYFDVYIYKLTGSHALY